MEDQKWLSQQLELLLTAYGYNLYNDANRARADDLLVRQRASEALGRAVGHLSRLESEFSARFVPPATREQPFPPADVLARLKRIEGLRAETSLLSSRIRGMSAPTQDRTWARFRQEVPLLQELLHSDYRLITAADALEQHTASLQAESWTYQQAEELRSQLQGVEELARAREELLTRGL